MVRGRCTVVEIVTHQVDGEQSTTLSESRYSKQLLSEEQPFIRKGRAVESWQPLIPGWLPQTSLLCLKNDPGRFNKIPSKEEREELAGKVLEIVFVQEGEEKKRTMHDTPVQEREPDICIPTGESCRFSPYDLSRIRIRCRNGETPYTLSLTPL